MGRQYRWIKTIVPVDLSIHFAHTLTFIIIIIIIIIIKIYIYYKYKRITARVPFPSDFLEIIAKLWTLVHRINKISVTCDRTIFVLSTTNIFAKLRWHGNLTSHRHIDSSMSIIIGFFLFCIMYDVCLYIVPCNHGWPMGGNMCALTMDIEGACFVLSHSKLRSIFLDLHQYKNELRMNP